MLYDEIRATVEVDRLTKRGFHLLGDTIGLKYRLLCSMQGHYLGLIGGYTGYVILRFGHDLFIIDHYLLKAFAQQVAKDGCGLSLLAEYHLRCLGAFQVVLQGDPHFFQFQYIGVQLGSVLAFSCSAYDNPEILRLDAFHYPL